ncbi:hypothetical protein [Enterobacter sp. SA187]|uniref:hypothetical protein n=1 Tax=Enterobacter sp. SA187 TaxID=1914861 RepID=UPI0009324BC5|nr:hypothetical protein [Enterobacter sp. SA187]
MHEKKYDPNDRDLVERVMNTGLSEYKTQKIINAANAKGLSLQKTYRLTEARIFSVDVIIATIMLFFIISIVLLDPGALWVFIFVFGLLFITIEVVVRSHKNYWKMLKIYHGLRGL